MSCVSIFIWSSESLRYRCSKDVALLLKTEMPRSPDSPGIELGSCLMSPSDQRYAEDADFVESLSIALLSWACFDYRSLDWVRHYWYVGVNEM